MEKEFTYSVKEAIIKMEGAQYEALEKAYDCIVDDQSNDLAKAECLQFIMDMIAEMTDRKRTVLHLGNPKVEHTQDPAVSTDSVPTEAPCVKVTLRLNKETDVCTMAKAESIVDQFTPYVANWSGIIKNILNKEDHTTTIAKCMPKNLAEIMVKELNTLSGITANYE